jgi:hypothetical protein
MRGCRRIEGWQPTAVASAMLVGVSSRLRKQTVSRFSEWHRCPIQDSFCISDSKFSQFEMSSLRRSV